MLGEIYVANKDPKTKRRKMRKRIVVGTAIVIAMLSTIAISGCFEKSQELKITDFKAEDLESVSNWGYVYEINSGESVKLILTVENKGKETAYRNDYHVGIKVVSPDNGNKYWVLPSEKILGSDLSTKGTVNQTFVIKNKKEEPVSGQFKIRGYIKSLESGEEIAQSADVIIKVKSS